MGQVGLFTTIDAAPDTVMKGFAGAMITYSSAGMAPLLTALGANVDRSYRDVRVEWTEKQHITGTNAIVHNHGDPLGSLFTFADASWVTENTLLMVITTGEFLYVTGVQDRVVSVIRGFGNTAKQPIVPNAASDVLLQRVGTAFTEGSERPEPVSFYHSNLFNYNQIFRNTWAVTRTAAMRNYREGDLTARLKKDALMQHVRDIEMTVLFGVKSYSVQNGKPLRTMDGLYRQISTNIAAPYDGVLTVPMLDDFLERIFSRNIDGKPNVRIAICGRGFITLVNRLARMSRHYTTDGTADWFGQAVTTWVTPHGTIKLVPHEILSEVPGYRNDLIVLHPSAVSVLYMYEGQQEHNGAQGNDGVDSNIGGLITEMTMKLEGQLTCGIMTGVCDVAGESQAVYLAQPHVSLPNPGC